MRRMQGEVPEESNSVRKVFCFANNFARFASRSRRRKEQEYYGWTVKVRDGSYL